MSYQERANWAASLRPQMQLFGNPKVRDFVQKAFAAEKASGSPPEKSARSGARRTMQV